MTFRTTLLSTVAAIALAVPSMAQTTTETDAETGADAEMSPVEEVEANIADAVEEGFEEDTDATPADTAPSVDRDPSDYSAFTGMTVSDVVGMPVEAANGDNVGEIDYIFATDEGYDAVIGIGGFLGLGEYTVALPLGSFTLDALRQVLVLDVLTEEDLRALPEVDESELAALPGEFVIGS